MLSDLTNTFHNNKKIENKLQPQLETDKLDLSYKLLLINKIFKKYPGISKYNYSEVSKKILVDQGVYISAKECALIVVKYLFVINHSNKYCGALAAITSLILFLTGTTSWIQFFIILAIYPLVFNIFNESIVMVKTILFDQHELTPPIEKDFNSMESLAIIIPSRNEPFSVAKMTFDSAFNLIYPSDKKEIIVVDNSDSTFSEYSLWKNYVESYSDSKLKNGVKVTFIHRDGTEGFKPRNIDIGLAKVTSSLVLFLDIDSTIGADTLLRVVPSFNRDAYLGFAQIQTIPTNINGLSSLAIPHSLRSYFMRLQSAFSMFASHELFYGHNAIWRTSVIREMGGCLDYHKGEVIVTEDLSMSFRARFCGYYGISVYVESGEWVPESLRETEAMWLRWTVGAYQVYSKYFKINNLRKFTKQELLGWLNHIGIFVVYGILPLNIIIGLLINSTLMMFISCLSLLPELIQLLGVQHKLSLNKMKSLEKLKNGYLAFFVLSTFINWVRFIGLFRFIIGTKQGWKPTGKSAENEIPIFSVIKDRWGFMLFGMSIFTYSVFSLLYVTENIFNSILIFLCGLYGANSLLCVYLFGRSRMKKSESEDTLKQDITDFSSFYLKEQ